VPHSLSCHEVQFQCGGSVAADPRVLHISTEENHPEIVGSLTLLATVVNLKVEFLRSNSSYNCSNFRMIVLTSWYHICLSYTSYYLIYYQLIPISYVLYSLILMSIHSLLLDIILFFIYYQLLTPISILSSIIYYSIHYLLYMYQLIHCILLLLLYLSYLLLYLLSGTIRLHITYLPT